MISASDEERILVGGCNAGAGIECGGDHSGDIRCDGDVRVGGDIEADNIKGNVTCHSVKCDKIAGNVTITGPSKN